MTNKRYTYIPQRMKSVNKEDPYVTSAEDIDAGDGKSQQVKNTEVDKTLTQLSNKIDAVNKQDIIPVDTLPAVATADPKKIYRVVGEDSYTDYMVNATHDGWKELATYSFPGIDDKPTAGSDNPVKSGGVQNELVLGAVYDVSAKNPTAGPNNDGKWESLSALLSDANLNTLVPTAVRKGGMSIKFVCSSDNNYVQYRLMADSFTTDITQWQGVDDEPVIGSKNLVESGGVEKSYIKMPYQTIPNSIIRNAVVNIGVPSWSVKKYRIESGIIILQGNVYSEGDYYDIAFFSDYDNVTSSANLIAREHLASATQRFVIPNGTKCVCISCNATTAPNEIISFSPRDYSYIVEDAEKTYLPTPYEVVSGYVTSGRIVAGGLWETHKYRLEQGRLLLENNIAIGGEGLAVGFFSDYDTINNNTFVGSFDESTHEVEIPRGTKCVCISYHPVIAPVKVVNFTPIYSVESSLPVESKTVPGYINQNGSIINAGGTWITKIYRYHGGYITINGDNIGTLDVDIAFYSDYDNPSQNNVISLHQRNALTQEFLVPAGAVCFAITTKSNNENFNKVVSFSPNNEQRFIDVENYHKEYIKGNVICKSFSFSGKTATFVGDSITRGFTSGSTVTNENYVKIFSERVGLTPTNRAIGGAAFTEGYNEVLTLQEQLEQAAVTSDFLFVAGGVNDWQLNVTDTDFRQAVTNICDYIQEHFNGTVIFITPINCIRTNNNPLPLDYYISTLIEIVAGYGYNIVCGSYFPFPSKSGAADAVFGDNIHPSELGYKIYAGSLQSVLC